MDMQFGADDVRILAQPRVFDGHFSVRKLSVQHRTFGGGWSQPLTREIFDRGDAVGVLLWDVQADVLVMLEQFRPGAIRDSDSPWMLELVAGVVESGEDDDEVARRESVEEAGLQLQALEPIASFFPSAGACSEQVRLFVASVDSTGAGGIHGCADEGEDIRVHCLPRQVVLDELAADRISNGHTLIALQWLQIHGEALRQRWM